MCIKIGKEPKIIMGIAMIVGVIVCVPFISVYWALWFGEVEIGESVCASIPDSTLAQTVARCVEVDFWGEVAIVTFLVLMTALACFTDEKITEFMTLKTTSLIVIILSFFSILWYCYCFYITYSLLFSLERQGFDCGRLIPYMNYLGFIGIITKIALIVTLTIRPAQPMISPEQRSEQPYNQNSQQIIQTTAAREQ